MFDADARARKIVVDRVSEWWAIPLTDEQRPNKLIHAKLQEMVAAALKAAYNEGLEDAATLAANVYQHTASYTHERNYAERICPRIAASVRAKKVPT